MTLINEMLNNLKNQDPNKVTDAKGQKSSHRDRSSAKRSRNAIFISTLVVIIGISAAIGVTYVMYPQYYKVAKNAVYSTFKTQLASEGAKRTKSPLQGLYYRAVNDLNEGNVDEALAELKVIMEKDPQFEPAKTTYDMVINRS